MDDLERIREKKLKELEEKMKKPVTLTDEGFESALKKYDLLVVDFWAPWCGPCRMMSPVIDELSEAYSGKVVFGKLNVDENHRTASQYGIMSIPTLLLFKGGEVVGNITGAVPKSSLQENIERTLL